MGNFSKYFLLTVVFALLLMGCEILGSKIDDPSADDPHSKYRLTSVDIVNDSTSTTGNHQVYEYGSDGKLTDITTYYGPIAGPFIAPVETRKVTYPSATEKNVHIERIDEDESDSTYGYNAEGILIKLEYKKGSEHELDTLEMDSEGFAKETTHFSKGSPTRKITHTLDVPTGKVGVDSLFTLPDLELVGFIKYIYGPDSSLTEKEIHQLARGGIDHYKTEKITYNIEGQISLWEEYNAGIDETLLEFITFFYDSDKLLTKIRRTDGIDLIILQERSFSWELKPGATPKRSVQSITISKTNNPITLGTSSGLSVQKLADWESLYQQQEVEK